MIWLNKPVLWHSSRVNGYNFKIMTPYEATLARNYWLSVRVTTRRAGALMTDTREVVHVRLGVRSDDNRLFLYSYRYLPFGQPSLPVEVASDFVLVSLFPPPLTASFFEMTSRSLPRPAVPGTATSTPTALDRGAALVRYGNAHQFRVGAGVLGEWYSPPLSSILGVLGLFIFVMGSLFSYPCFKLRSRTTHCSALMLGKRPYYWPSRNLGHSMPIATRTGWISIAIMPFMMCAFPTSLASSVTHWS
jgi:hypothetical protein